MKRPVIVVSPLLKMASDAAQSGWYPNPERLFRAAQPTDAGLDAANKVSETPMGILVHLLYGLCSATGPG